MFEHNTFNPELSKSELEDTINGLLRKGRLNVKITLISIEWDNLSQGEIAAVVVGALLLLLLVILLIIAIVYCVRKKTSHDLPYTQRYGSRQPPRSERTSF